MGVQIDKARRHQFAAGVDLLGAFAQHPADLDNAAVRYRDIRFEQFAAKPVGDAAAADHEVWIIGHGVSSRVEFCWRIMGCQAWLSTARDGAQECISLASAPAERFSGPRSVKSASKTVRIMNMADAPNTQCGIF
jgi:hypothetical protein